MAEPKTTPLPRLRLPYGGAALRAAASACASASSLADIRAFSLATSAG